MKKFNLRNHLTPELKHQFAKAEEKNHFDQRMKQKDKEEVELTFDFMGILVVTGKFKLGMNFVKN